MIPSFLCILINLVFFTIFALSSYALIEIFLPKIKNNEKVFVGFSVWYSVYVFVAFLIGFLPKGLLYWSWIYTLISIVLILILIIKRIVILKNYTNKIIKNYITLLYQKFCNFSFYTMVYVSIISINIFGFIILTITSTFVVWDEIQTYLRLAYLFFEIKSFPSVIPDMLQVVYNGGAPYSLFLSWPIFISNNTCSHSYLFMPIIFYIGICSLIYSICMECFNSSDVAYLSILSFVTGAFIQTYAKLNYGFLPDILMAFLFCTSVFLFYIGYNRQDIILIIISGFISGIAIITKIQGIYTPIMICVLMSIIAKEKLTRIISTIFYVMFFMYFIINIRYFEVILVIFSFSINIIYIIVNYTYLKNKTINVAMFYKQIKIYGLYIIPLIIVFFSWQLKGYPVTKSLFHPFILLSKDVKWITNIFNNAVSNIWIEYGFETFSLFSLHEMNLYISFLLLIGVNFFPTYLVPKIFGIVKLFHFKNKGSFIMWITILLFVLWLPIYIPTVERTLMLILPFIAIISGYGIQTLSIYVSKSNVKTTIFNIFLVCYILSFPLQHFFEYITGNLYLSEITNWYWLIYRTPEIYNKILIYTILSTVLISLYAVVKFLIRRFLIKIEIT